MFDSDERMLKGDSPEVITKTGNTTTEEVTNAALLKTYMNNKLSGIDLAKKVKKSENSLKFKGNQVQFELNTDIQDNLNSALKYIKCDRSKKAITLIEESLAALKKTQQIDTHSGQVGRRLDDCRRIPV